jgi:hypothetical protein
LRNWLIRSVFISELIIQSSSPCKGLCAALNERQPVFPETDYHLR